MSLPKQFSSVQLMKTAVYHTLQLCFLSSVLIVEEWKVERDEWRYYTQNQYISAIKVGNKMASGIGK